MKNVNIIFSERTCENYDEEVKKLVNYVTSCGLTEFTVQVGEKTKKVILAQILINRSRLEAYAILTGDSRLYFEPVSDYDIIIDPVFKEVVYDKEVYEVIVEPTSYGVNSRNFGGKPHPLFQALIQAERSDKDVVRFGDTEIAIGKKLENGSIRLSNSERELVKTLPLTDGTLRLKNITWVYNPENYVYLP